MKNTIQPPPPSENVGRLCKQKTIDFFKLGHKKAAQKILINRDSKCFPSVSAVGGALFARVEFEAPYWCAELRDAKTKIANRSRDIDEAISETIEMWVGE